MATAIVSLYDPGGAPLDIVCWPSDLAAAMEGFTALHYHSKEAYSVWAADVAATAEGTLAQLRLAMHRLLRCMEPGVRAHFISCGVEEERTFSCVILQRDATYNVPEATT